jgi:hypothetical protein
MKKGTKWKRQRWIKMEEQTWGFGCHLWRRHNGATTNFFLPVLAGLNRATHTPHPAITSHISSECKGIGTFILVPLLRFQSLSTLCSGIQRSSHTGWKFCQTNPYHYSILLWLYSPLLDLGRFFSFLIYTQSVGLIRWGISPSQGRSLCTEHKHRINAHRHPCLEWNSNPRSQRSSGWRLFIPSTARPLWSANLYHPIPKLPDMRAVSHAIRGNVKISRLPFIIYEIPNLKKQVTSYSIPAEQR